MSTKRLEHKLPYNFIQNTSKLETTQLSINKWMDTQFVEFCRTEYYSAIERNTLNTWNTREFLKQKKSNRKESIFYTCTYEILKEANLTCRDRKHINGSLGAGASCRWGAGAEHKVAWGSCAGDGNVLYLVVLLATQVHKFARPHQTYDGCTLLYFNESWFQNIRQGLWRTYSTEETMECL